MEKSKRKNDQPSWKNYIGLLLGGIILALGFFAYAFQSTEIVTFLSITGLAASFLGSAFLTAQLAGELENSTKSQTVRQWINNLGSFAMVVFLLLGVATMVFPLLVEASRYSEFFRELVQFLVVNTNNRGITFLSFEMGFGLLFANSVVMVWKRIVKEGIRPVTVEDALLERLDDKYSVDESEEDPAEADDEESLNQTKR